MKKILFLLLIIFVIFFSNVQSRDEYLYLKDDTSYNIYSVSIDNLNTNNFVSFFNDISVVRIYPKVNSIYKSLLGNLFYEFRSDDLSKEVSLFKNYYLSLIKKNSYDDYNYLYINGIDILSVDIYINGSRLYDFLLKYGAIIN